MSARLSKSAVLGALPALWPHDLSPHIRAAVAANPERKIIVLDDDPTGTQLVYDVPVLTVWDEDSLRAEFHATEPSFHILTQSRLLAEEEARERLSEVARNLRSAAGPRPFTLISRSDSTLRGHFPLETDVLSEVMGPFDATLLIPCFEDSGRFTIDDVHYVASGDELIPVAETLHARAGEFAFRSSHLPTYMAEKSGGRIRANEVRCLSIATLRGGGPAQVAAWLLELPRGAHGVVNATTGRDIEVFVVGLLHAEEQGRRYCLRTSAQFPAERLGLNRPPMHDARTLELQEKAASGTTGEKSPRTHAFPSAVLPPGEPHRIPNPPTKKPDRPAVTSVLPPTGGLILIATPEPTTRRQLAHLPPSRRRLHLELPAEQLLSSRRRRLLDHAVAILFQALSTEQDVLVCLSGASANTKGDTMADQLIWTRLSEAMVELVHRLEIRPRFLLVKGAITAVAVATQALGVKRAMAIGPLIPGVPVWRLGLESKFPGLPLIVFPGNVGGTDGLAYAIRQLTPGF